jgi:hypothetical protein
MNIVGCCVGQSHVQAIIVVSIHVGGSFARSINQDSNVGVRANAVPDITIKVSIEIADDLQSNPHIREFHNVGGDNANILNASTRSIGNSSVEPVKKISLRAMPIETHQAQLKNKSRKSELKNFHYVTSGPSTAIACTAARPRPKQKKHNPDHLPVGGNNLTSCRLFLKIAQVNFEHRFGPKNCKPHYPSMPISIAPEAISRVK